MAQTFFSFVAYAMVSVLLSFLLWQFLNHTSRNNAWTIATFFVFISTMISLGSIYKHITCYRSTLQRHYIRILFLVPIYSIQSWCALKWYSHSIIFDSLVNAYEAFVMYNFFSLMRDFLGEDDEERVTRIISKIGTDRVEHLKWFCFCFTPLLPKWKRGEELLRRTQSGVLQ